MVRGQVTSSSSVHHRPTKHPHSNPPRRRRAILSSPKTPPSTCLLSILATIAACSSSANGNPITAQPTSPPVYLCPFVDQGDTDLVPPDHLRASGSGCTSANTPSSSARIQKRWAIADKYAQSSDGRWYRVENYTLHGSTVCPRCTTTPTHTLTPAPTPVINGTVSGDPKPLPSDNPDSGVFDSLPNGWKPTPKPHRARTTLILALSLVLALFICSLITCCLLWRRQKRRRRKRHDLEMKERSTKSAARRAEEEMEKVVRQKVKFWAKATTRWKANAHVRQRKRKRPSSVVKGLSAQGSSVSLHDRRSTTYPLPLSRATTPTPRPPSVDITSSSSIRSHLGSIADEGGIVVAPLDLLPASVTHEIMLPPAYPHRRRPPDTRDHKTSQMQSDASHSDSHPPEFYQCLSTRDVDAYPTEDDNITYVPISAHVATDDKAVLARMAAFASAPAASAGDEGVVASASVPVWQDEELDDFGEEALTGTSGPLEGIHPAQPFPPPPSKGKMAASTFYEYTYDMDTLEADAGPSPPPFHAVNHPSAPPHDEGSPSVPGLDDMDFAPSAPPMDEHEDVVASAPALGDVVLPTQENTNRDRGDTRGPLDVSSPVKGTRQPPEYDS